MSMTEFLKDDTVLTISYWLLLAVACIIAWCWFMHLVELGDAQWRRDNPLLPPSDTSASARDHAKAQRELELALARCGVYGRDREDILRGSKLK